MMTARKELPGHAVYNRVRNADEICNLWMQREQPQTKKELIEWLVQWEQGDKTTRGPPNFWDVQLITNMDWLFRKEGLENFNDRLDVRKSFFLGVLVSIFFWGVLLKNRIFPHKV